MKDSRIATCAAVLGLALGLAAGSANAQAWPSKPVLMVNPYAAGAGVDPVARLVAQKLSERLGQQVIVENKTGAAGMVGATFVAKARPDGYTIMMSAAGDIAINQHLYKNMQYNAEKDLAPVTQAVRLPFLLVAHPSVPANNVRELVALAKGKPNAFAYASAGNGSLQHEPLYDGLVVLLDRLEGAGWLLAVATGKSDRGLDLCLTHHGIKQRFISLQTADRHPSKPHPSMIYQALADAGALAEHAVMIGDRRMDIEGARHHGMDNIGVLWGFGGEEELRAAGAARIAATPAELLSLVDSRHIAAVS